MNTPFVNDMFSMVYQAFKNLYPDKECECQWQPEKMTDEDGAEVFGITTYGDNGEIFVDISAHLKVVDAVEILAHELAHVAVGADANHGKAWEDAFDAIHNEFNRIGDEMFDDNGGVAVDVVSGKAYVRENKEKYEPCDSLALLKEQDSCENCTIAIEDRQPVIRCKYCKHWDEEHDGHCTINHIFTIPDFYCADGERR